MNKKITSTALCLTTLAATAHAQRGRLEDVAHFYGPMPTGVTVSHTGRIFVNFPRWGDPVKYTVAEVVHGQTVAYPPGLPNHAEKKNPYNGLVSVQSVVVDPADRLWLLDTGSVKMGPAIPGGAKLVGVDLRTGRVVKKIIFPPDVALKTSSINDVRFDLRRGKGGMAFITDASIAGPNAIIVVDLATGKSRRRLNNHPSTRPVPNFRPIVEGHILANRLPGKPPKPIHFGADGIAISANGKTLYYSPLASRHLYSVSVDALANPDATDDAVAATVRDLGVKGASDGLESNARGEVYCGDYEHNAIKIRSANGTYRPLVQDARLIWPDTMSVATNGYLYVTANQLDRSGQYHYAKDLRRKPYHLYRVHINARPVLLK